ncbi:ATP-binding protein [Bacillus coahuilensis]|uniref:ATP-binding protein n=1 Tax=Bacillus coahuilensis TaxID=408580 RepID=UPI0002D30CCB|nr:ATP-binding protein [Bacillus coahuilensis]
MKNHSSPIKFPTYMKSVLFPLLIILLLYSIIRFHYMKIEAMQHLESNSTIYQMKIEQFFYEDLNLLTSLSMVHSLTKMEDTELSSLLSLQNHLDHHLSNLIYLDTSGNIKDSYKKIEDPALSIELIKAAKNVTQTYTLTPLFAQNEELILMTIPLSNKEVLIGIVPVKELSDYIKTLPMNDSIQIQSLSTRYTYPTLSTTKHLSLTFSNEVELDFIPWKMTVYSDDQWLIRLLLELILLLIGVYIFLHVLYLVRKYKSLQALSDVEKKENNAQKLELIGQFSASIAHEIRNPLTGIKGLIQLLNEKYNDKADDMYFSIIYKEINRINDIVGEFLMLGKPSGVSLKISDLRDVLIEITPIIQSEANLYNVHYSYEFPTRPLLVKMSSDQMKQVLLNLSKNGLEAMEEGGLLHIKLSSKGEWIEIKIRDTGSGINEENVPKLFDPFFTSKSEGTGLGLPVCKRIIESINGQISIASKENEWTEVTILLPSP